MKSAHRRLVAMIIIVSVLPGLGGCGRTLNNYREVEQLLVIQTMGIDRKSGGTLLSLASAAEGAPDGSPRRLSASGDCVSTALKRIYELSYEEELFCYHISSILIGEEAAEAGIEEYLSFICRSPYMRIKSPIFVLRDGTAEEAVMEAGDGGKGISEIMQSVRQRLLRRGAGSLTDSARIISELRRYGSTLVCALELSDAAESLDGEEKSGQTAMVSGYAVIREGRLCRYIEAEDAVAVDLLLNHVDESELQIRDRQERRIVLELFDGGSEIIPVWSAPGALQGLDVRVHVSASVLEATGAETLEDAEYLDQLTAALEESISRKLSKVLQGCGELRSDYLGLAGRVEQASPRYFRMMSGDFPDALPLLELQISVSGEIVHTNDLKEA